MVKKNKKNYKTVWLSALVLFVCVAATTVAFVSRLGGFLPDDSGAISLIPERTPDITIREESDVSKNGSTVSTETSRFDESVPDVSEGVSDAGESSKNEDVSAEHSQGVNNDVHPGFEVGDEDKLWSTDTQVEIFRVSYVNGEKVVTVQSGDGDKVIAPGTENSYTFKLKNTGNVALDYTVEIDAYFTPDWTPIPIKGRLSCYDGRWVVGSGAHYVTVPELDMATDTATLGAGKFTYYTLDWVWPFESGDDELDTMLGNLAVDEDLTFTIVIKTVAAMSDDQSNDSGILPPDTGDDVRTSLWSAIAVGSFLLMLFLLIGTSKEKRRN